MAISVRAIKVAAVCVGLALSGCYEVKYPIITPKMAVEVPSLEGEIYGSEGDRYVFIYNAQSRAYSIWNPRDGSLELVSLQVLVIPLRDNFYWFQARKRKRDSPLGFYLWLSKFENAKKLWTEFHMPDMTEAALHAFAGQFGVKIVDGVLSGSRDDILEFMKAHAHVQLRELHGP